MRLLVDVYQFKRHGKLFRPNRIEQVRSFSCWGFGSSRASPRRRGLHRRNEPPDCDSIVLQDFTAQRVEGEIQINTSLLSPI